MVVNPSEWLGAQIRTLRYRRGLTQAQLAYKAGVGEKTLKRLEAGHTDAPRPETVAAVAGALGLKPEELFAEADAAAAAEALQVPSPAVHQLPRPPLNFTGRLRELAELDAQLVERNADVIGIHGMGGMGKTALALVIAERWSERFADGQFYIDLLGATVPMTPSEAMLHVIRSLDPTRPPPKTENEVAAAYRSTLRGKRALLMMDNASGREQLEPLLPPEGCLLLITSRQRFALPGLHALSLAPLQEHESRALIDTLAPHAAAVGERLATLCGGLPLALSLAGRALAERPDVSPTEYTAKLADDSGRLRQLDAAGTSGGVEASFDLSYGMLDAAQQQGLCALAVFPRHFDRAAAAAVWELSDELTDARIGMLLRFHLLEWDGVGDSARYRLHDLVRLFASARLAAADRVRLEMRHAHHYLTLLRTINDAAQTGSEDVAVAIVDREWPHIRTAFEHCCEHATANPEAARLASQAPDASLVLRQQQHPRERVAWCEIAAQIASSLSERRLQGRLLAQLAVACQQLGDPRKALEQCDHALEFAVAEGDRLTEAYALVARGDARHALGEPRLAIESAERGLALARQLDASATVAAALMVLAWGHHVAGESDRAVDYAEQSLPISRAIGDRMLEAMGLLLLGYALQAVGQPERSLTHATQCLWIARTTGNRRAEGYALLLMGTRDTIDEQIALAVDIAIEIGDRRLEGNAYLYLANAHRERGASSESLEAAERALEIGEETNDRALVGRSLITLGVASAALHDLVRAVDAFSRAKEASREIGNPRQEAVAAWLLQASLDASRKSANAIDR